jgi:hypothetical protein
VSTELGDPDIERCEVCGEYVDAPCSPLCSCPECLDLDAPDDEEES